MLYLFSTCKQQHIIIIKIQDAILVGGPQPPWLPRGSPSVLQTIERVTQALDHPLGQLEGQALPLGHAMTSQVQIAAQITVLSHCNVKMRPTCRSATGRHDREEGM